MKPVDLHWPPHSLTNRLSTSHPGETRSRTFSFLESLQITAKSQIGKLQMAVISQNGKSITLRLLLFWVMRLLKTYFLTSMQSENLFRSTITGSALSVF